MMLSKLFYVALVLWLAFLAFMGRACYAQDDPTLQVDFSFDGPAVAYLLKKEGVTACTIPVADVTETTNKQFQCAVALDPGYVNFTMAAQLDDDTFSPDSEPYRFYVKGEQVQIITIQVIGGQVTIIHENVDPAPQQ